jgi:crotonobetainyl-CoA:carnitine CoA-transferase CaiB-like acyl-CoA transferase
VLGTLAALYRRGQDGHGRHVETSLLDGALSFLAMMWGDSEDEALTPPHRPERIFSPMAGPCDLDRHA